MCKNYWKTAWRNLKTHRFYSLLNIGGLAVGLATAVMLLLWVRDERSFDRFHKDYREIYQVTARVHSGSEEMTWHGVPGPLAVFGTSIPSVVSTVRMKEDIGQVIANQDRSKVIDGNRTAFVDSTFFSIFDFKLLEGDRNHLFPDDHSAVITRRLAGKFFGADEVLGKVIDYQGNKYTVTGVLEDFPENSSIQLDAVFPMAVYGRQFTGSGGNGAWKTIDTDLGDFSFTTFVKLRKDAGPGAVERALTNEYAKTHTNGMGTRFQLESLSDIHLIEADGNRSRLQMVRVFFLVAILLLAIAAVNYVNLSTARALVRSQEVSIRKVTGATRSQLFFQFIVETLLLFSVALVIAFLLIILLMPLYNQISGKDLRFSFADTGMWALIGTSVIGTLLVSSLYPAWLLSSFRPMETLKGKLSQAMGTVVFRKALVVFQFAISVILIISTLVIGLQMRYIRHKSLGYDKSYVFSVPLRGAALSHAEAIKNALARNLSIIGSGRSNFYDLSDYGNSSSDIEWAGKPPNSSLVLGQAVVDKDFIPVMKMQLVEGKNFSGTPADSSYYIINQEAGREMGLQPPYVGQMLTFHDRKGEILGVLKDFNFKSLKEKISPILLESHDFKGNILFVRAAPARLPAAIAAVKKEYKKYAGDIPFSYSFIDKQLEDRYRSDTQAGLLLNLFAVIAIFISCLGLLGLATYTAQIRTKEIGIRRVLGASVGSILNLLGQDFMVLVLLAIVVAVPVALYGTHRWLSDFAYQARIPWWIWGIAAGLSIMIAVVTVCSQALRAAMANPVKSLRSE